MASIQRRPNFKFWHASWYDTNGRQILRFTKQTDRNQAPAVAVERAERLVKETQANETQFLKFLNGIMVRSGSTERLGTTSVCSWMNEWLRRKLGWTVGRLPTPPDASSPSARSIPCTTLLCSTWPTPAPIPRSGASSQASRPSPLTTFSPTLNAKPSKLPSIPSLPLQSFEADRGGNRRRTPSPFQNPDKNLSPIGNKRQDNYRYSFLFMLSRWTPAIPPQRHRFAVREKCRGFNLSSIRRRRKKPHDIQTHVHAHHPFKPNTSGDGTNCAIALTICVISDYNAEFSAAENNRVAMTPLSSNPFSIPCRGFPCNNSTSESRIDTPCSAGCFVTPAR